MICKCKSNVEVDSILVEIVIIWKWQWPLFILSLFNCLLALLFMLINALNVYLQMLYIYKYNICCFIMPIEKKFWVSFKTHNLSNLNFVDELQTTKWVSRLIFYLNRNLWTNSEMINEFLGSSSICLESAETNLVWKNEISGS